MANTNFTITDIDIGSGANLVLKEYVIDRYAEMPNVFKAPTLWGWGSNLGALGNNSGLKQSSPVQTIAAGANWKYIAAGVDLTAAIKTDGSLWAWGYNAYGEVGDNTNATKSSPVQTVAAGTTWKQVNAIGSGVGAIKTDGTLWVWGYNNWGQLGTNNQTNYSSPVQTVAGGTNWKQIAGGLGSFVTAIKTDGTLWGWGYNGSGSLGTNDITNRSSPVQTVAGGTSWKQVSAHGHTAAIKSDGTLWTWGYNNSGQLGTNNTTSRSSPAQTVAGGTNWKQVSCGFTCTGAIKTDGTLWMWGTNNYGELGTNNLSVYYTPTQINLETNWKQIVCGNYFTAAIKTDGTLWTWGYNNNGQLGTNDTSGYSSPVQTIASGTNWKQVALSGSHMVAIRDDSSDIYGDPV